MRVVFFGTPEFAVPSLEAVARAHGVALVVAQPDKPAGRGMKMHAPAVILRARELGLPTAQPPKIRNEEFLAQIRALQPDAGIVVAYGLEGANASIWPWNEPYEITITGTNSSTKTALDKLYYEFYPERRLPSLADLAARAEAAR